MTPEVMEGFLKRVSYSFKDLYDNKLKDIIFAKLDILDMPEERKELEAQKVFIYIRMTKNISMMNSGAINGKKLDDMMEDTICEYEKAYNFIKEHVGDGLEYNELKKLLKQFDIHKDFQQQF